MLLLIISTAIMTLSPHIAHGQETYSVAFDPEFLQVNAGAITAVQVSITGPSGTMEELTVDPEGAPITTSISPDEGEVPIIAEMIIAIDSSADVGSYQILLQSTIHKDDGGMAQITSTYPVNVLASEENNEETSNSPPVAQNDSVSIEEDSSLDIELLASDSEGDMLNFSIIDSPAHGELSGLYQIESDIARVTYTGNPEYYGEDSFTFIARDGTHESNIATISLTITPVNDAPVAIPKSVTTVEFQQVGVVFGGQDVDGDNLTISIIASPQHGHLGSVQGVSTTSAYVVYSPNENYYGNDSFQFAVADGHLTSSPATVSLTIQAIEDQQPVQEEEGFDFSIDSADIDLEVGKSASVDIHLTRLSGETSLVNVSCGSANYNYIDCVMNHSGQVYPTADVQFEVSALQAAPLGLHEVTVYGYDSLHDLMRTGTIRINVIAQESLTTEAEDDTEQGISTEETFINCKSDYSIVEQQGVSLLDCQDLDDDILKDIYDWILTRHSPETALIALSKMAIIDKDCPGFGPCLDHMYPETEEPPSKEKEKFTLREETPGEFLFCHVIVEPDNPPKQEEPPAKTPPYELPPDYWLPNSPGYDPNTPIPNYNMNYGDGDFEGAPDTVVRFEWGWLFMKHGIASTLEPMELEITFVSLEDVTAEKLDTTGSGSTSVIESSEETTGGTGIDIRADVLASDVSQYSVSISWRASDGAKYNIYRGTSPLDEFTRVNTEPVTEPTFIDDTVIPDQEYHYYVTAIDENGVESGRSEVIRATTFVGASGSESDTATEESAPVQYEVGSPLEMLIPLILSITLGVIAAVAGIFFILRRAKLSGASGSDTLPIATIAGEVPPTSGEEDLTSGGDEFHRGEEDECVCTKNVDEVPMIKQSITYPKNATIARGDPVLVVAEAVDIHEFSLTCEHTCKEGETPSKVTGKITFPDALTFEWKIKEEKIIRVHSTSYKYDPKEGWMYWSSKETVQEGDLTSEKGFLMDADYFAKGKYLKDRPQTCVGEQVLYVPPYKRLEYSRSDASDHRICISCQSKAPRGNLHITNTYALVTLTCKVTGSRCGKSVESDVVFKVNTENPLTVVVQRYGAGNSIERPALEEKAPGAGECFPRFQKRADPDFSAEPRVKNPVCYNESPLIVGVKGEDIDELRYKCCEDEEKIDVTDQLLGQWQSGDCTILSNGLPLNIAVQPKGSSPLFSKQKPHHSSTIICNIKDYPFAADGQKKKDIQCSDEFPCSLVVYVSTKANSFPEGIATFGHAWIGIRHWYGDEILFGYYLRPYILDGQRGENSGNGVLLLEDRDRLKPDLKRHYLISENKCRKLRQMILERFGKPGEYNAFTNNCVDFVKEAASAAFIKKIAGAGGLEGIDTPGELWDSMWQEPGGEIPSPDE
jgi:hypothetical protein